MANSKSQSDADQGQFDDRPTVVCDCIRDCNFNLRLCIFTYFRKYFVDICVYYVSMRALLSLSDSLKIPSVLNKRTYDVDTTVCSRLGHTSCGDRNRRVSAGTELLSTW